VPEEQAFHNAAIGTKRAVEPAFVEGRNFTVKDNVSSSRGRDVGMPLDP
jgi:hypothetical protein